MALETARVLQEDMIGLLGLGNPAEQSSDVVQGFLRGLFAAEITTLEALGVKAKGSPFSEWAKIYRGVSEETGASLARDISKAAFALRNPEPVARTLTGALRGNRG
jgi:hypothetical protein